MYLLRSVLQNFDVHGRHDAAVLADLNSLAAHHYGGEKYSDQIGGEFNRRRCAGTSTRPIFYARDCLISDARAALAAGRSPDERLAARTAFCCPAAPPTT